MAPETSGSSSMAVTHRDLAVLRDQVLSSLEQVRTLAQALVLATDKRVDALFREHDVRYEQRFQAQGEALAAALTAAEKAVGAALTAADRAVQKAETSTDKRFEGVNEFRGMMNDILRDQLPRKEADQQFQQIAEKDAATNARIDILSLRLEKHEAQGEGAAGAGDRLARGIAVASALLGIGAWIYSANRPAVATVVTPLAPQTQAAPR